MSDYFLNEDGTATFELKKVTRVCRRPNLKEYRELVEALSSGDGKKDNITVRISLALEWWDTVFTLLAGEGLLKTKKLDGEGKVVKDENDEPIMIIDETKLEPWLITDVVIVGLIAHWQTFPSPPGDR